MLTARASNNNKTYATWHLMYIHVAREWVLIMHLTTKRMPANSTALCKKHFELFKVLQLTIGIVGATQANTGATWHASILKGH